MHATSHFPGAVNVRPCGVTPRHRLHHETRDKRRAESLALGITAVPDDSLPIRVADTTKNHLRGTASVAHHGLPFRVRAVAHEGDEAAFAERRTSPLADAACLPSSLRRTASASRAGVPVSPVRTCTVQRR